MGRLLDAIDAPRDLKRLAPSDLPALCQELRDEIVALCARNGGHLGSSLGAVELVVALHYAFESPRDRLVFDVGHQAYAHKLLTGRRERFRTLRAPGGLAGFPERQESEHDAFGVGHASTAVSAGLGLVEALRRRGAEGKVVALFGDGALTGGQTFEGLNQAGYLGRDLLAVFNDNGMSISPNVGALSGWFGPAGRAAAAGARPESFFEALGFEVVGPVDGHDVVALVDVFREVARRDRPVLVHARTVKGKGYPPAEQDLATHGHALSFFDVATGAPAPRKPGPPSWTELFAGALCEAMARDERVVAVTAAMLEGTGLVEAKRRFPDRTYDVGIAEPHAVTFAAGLACEGLRPVVAIYSGFLQRAFDQVVHDVALQRLPVTFALDRGGLVGADGKTHQGALDFTWLRCVPHLLVMAPSDEAELGRMLATALAHDGPAAFRFPRGAGLGVPVEPAPAPLELGKGRVVRDGGPAAEVALLAAGTPVKAALAAAEALAREGVAATVVDARFVKPLDEGLVCALARACGRLVTVEESSLAGGFGSACLEALERHDLLGEVRVRRLGLPDAFVAHGDAARQRAELGLDAAGIAAAARALLRERPRRRRSGPARPRGQYGYPSST